MKAASFEAIVRALNEAGVRYIVVGGVAVNAHGYGRATYDLDLVIHLAAENIIRAFAALESIGYHPQIPVKAEQFADEALRTSWRNDNGMIVLKMWSHRHRETPIDIFVTEPFDFEIEYAAVHRQELEAGCHAPILQLETLLAMKRGAGRPKDLADIDELHLLYGKPSSYDREQQRD